MKTHYVYKITDPSTRQFYIGSRTCDCKPENDNYMGSYYTWKPEDETRLQKEIIKSDFETRKRTIEYEASLIEENIDNELNENYHIPTKGFYAGFTGKSHNKETIKIIRNNFKNYVEENGYWMEGKSHSDAAKRKMSNIRKKWWNNIDEKTLEERSKKLSKKAKGRFVSEETKKKMSNSTIKWHKNNEHPKPMLGRKRKQETIEKIRKGNLGKKMPNSAKNKLKEFRKNKVACVDENGNKLIVSKKEFDKRDDLVGVTRGQAQPKLRKRLKDVKNDIVFDGVRKCMTHFDRSSSWVYTRIKKGRFEYYDQLDE